MTKKEQEERDQQTKDELAKSLGAKHVIQVDGKVAYLKPITRTVLSAAASVSDGVKSDELMMRNLIIKEVSDMDMLENDELFLAARKQLAYVVETKKSNYRTL